MPGLNIGLNKAQSDAIMAKLKEDGVYQGPMRELLDDAATLVADTAKSRWPHGGQVLGQVGVKLGTTHGGLAAATVKLGGQRRSALGGSETIQGIILNNGPKQASVAVGIPRTAKGRTLFSLKNPPARFKGMRRKTKGWFTGARRTLAVKRGIQELVNRALEKIAAAWRQ